MMSACLDTIGALAVLASIVVKIAAFRRARLCASRRENDHCRD
jgi:hypothetical protein